MPTGFVDRNKGKHQFGTIYQGENGEKNSMVIPVRVPDLSAAASHWAVAPIAGTIRGFYSVIEGAVSADTTLTPKLGGTAVTGGLITVTAAASAAGDVDSSTATALNTVSQGDAIEIACGGEGATASAGVVFAIIDF